MAQNISGKQGSIDIPEWLELVPRVMVTPREGQSEPGAGLEALAQVYGFKSVQAGEVLGAVVADAGHKSHAVLVSCGDIHRDRARVAQFYEVAPDAVSLMAMATLLDQYGGLMELQPLR